MSYLAAAVVKTQDKCISTSADLLEARLECHLGDTRVNRDAKPTSEASELLLFASDLRAAWAEKNQEIKRSAITTAPSTSGRVVGAGGPEFNHRVPGGASAGSWASRANNLPAGFDPDDPHLGSLDSAAAGPSSPKSASAAD